MKISMRVEKAIVCFAFISFLIIGLSVANDYGATIDEYNSYDFGYRWYKYTYDVVVNGHSLIPTHQETQADIIHGPLIEMSYAFLADKIFNFQDSRKIILLRHYCSWLLFYLGTVIFYFLCKRCFGNRFIALLGCFMLVLHPRIFSDSFYNTIDIALLVFYIISMFTLLRHRDLRTWQTMAWHALACAMLICVRSVGAIIPILTFSLYFRDVFNARHNKSDVLRVTGHILLFGVLLSLFIILFWPYLWRDPIGGTIEIIKQTPRILWGSTVLYFGEYIKSMQPLPWHYIPVWVGITTPLFYSLCFIIGFFVILKNLIIKKNGNRDEARRGVLFLFAFLMPIFLVIFLKSTLYDAWRHLFFIYPAFVLVALMGISSLNKSIEQSSLGRKMIAVKATVTTLFMLSFFSTSLFIVTNHPYQNVYFNRLAGKDMKTAKQNFELDYWGLSYRQALEYIVNNDERKHINVYDAIGPIGPMRNNIKIIPASDRQKLIQVNTIDKADYILTNYRWHKDDYPYSNEFFSIKVGNAKIMSVFMQQDLQTSSR